LFQTLNNPCSYLSFTEVLLCPFIPDGSQFLLRFTTRETNDGTATPLSIYSGRAPDSPCATPRPHPSSSNLAGLSSKQLALLRNQLNNLNISRETPKNGTYHSERRNRHERTAEKATTPKSILQSQKRIVGEDRNDGNPDEKKESNGGSGKLKDPGDEKETKEVPFSMDSDDEDDSVANLNDDEDDDMMLHSEDPIESRLRQITELLLNDRNDRKSSRRTNYRRQEKRQVVFLLANYFVLFLSLIAISAEIQARAPRWLAAMETHLSNVQNCAADKDALFNCVTNGDFAGLSASILLWLSRSVATRRFFLFGFETPQKLWTVVYEAMVTSFCWGVSYLFIRRGLNPDTRDRFVQKYWKDAIYGSLAGFNAAFLKAILKNLIPQEVVEDALRDRQLRILSFLPSFR
jgi:hypothetical protein